MKRKIRTSFLPPKTPKRNLKYLKDRIDPKQHRGVYHINCSCGCPYIGEIGISVAKWISKHSGDLRHDRIKNSALTEHSNTMKHHICIEDTEVVARVVHYTKRHLWKVVEIEKYPKNLKRDDSWNLNRNLLPNIHKINTIVSQRSHWLHY